MADAAVGVAPNEDFGYGKLRIYRSLYGEAPPDGSAPTIAVNSAMGRAVVMPPPVYIQTGSST